jgi:hypothetical protein
MGYSLQAMISLLFSNATKGVLLGQISYFFSPDALSTVAPIFSRGGNSKFSQIGAKKARDYSNPSH